MALSADKRRRTRNQGAMQLGEAEPAASTQFYQGGMVVWNSTGKIEKATAAANKSIAGVMPSNELTTSSPTGLRKFERLHEEWFALSGLDADDVGTDAFVVDDATVGPDPGDTTAVRVGEITGLETIGGVAGAWVAVGRIVANPPPDAA